MCDVDGSLQLIDVIGVIGIIGGGRLAPTRHHGVCVLVMACVRACVRVCEEWGGVGVAGGLLSNAGVSRVVTVAYARRPPREYGRGGRRAARLIAHRAAAAATRRTTARRRGAAQWRR